MIEYIGIFLLAVFISSCSQILLKMSAEKKYENKLREYLNVRVIVAYGLFFSATLATLYAYKVIPLSMGPILEASGYVWVSLLSLIILKEKISAKKAVGLVIIIAGIVVFAI